MLHERHARHALVPGWQQDRLGAATVVIVGVGALGNAAAQALALAGVGRLILCDPDVVAESNLGRGPLFRGDDVGRPKVLAVAGQLAALAPDVAVDPRVADLDGGVGLADLRDAAVVLGCLDNNAARVGLAGRCNLVGARLLDAGTTPWGGELRPFLDPEGPCFACGLAPEDRVTRDTPRSCHAGPAALVGASQPVSALVASWQALLAVRVVMGLAVAPERVVIDGAHGRAVRTAGTRDPGCLLHRPLPTATRLGLGPGATVAAVCAAVGDAGCVLLWRPAVVGWSCPGGHVVQDSGSGVCSSCGARARAVTTLALAELLPERTLAELGVPPREILAVQRGDEFACVELDAV